MNTKNKQTFIPSDYRPKVKGEKILVTQPPVPLNLKNKKKKVSAIVCIHVKEDCSQAKVIQKYNRGKKIVFLHYDDLGITWNFSFYKNVLKFYTQKEEILPKGIYNRPHSPPSTDPRFQLFSNFLSILDSHWKGQFIGPMSANFHNSSKPYQLTTTVRQTINHSGGQSIDFPRSFFIKGDESFCLNFLQNSQNLIVKSCSGIRSQVATFDVFQKWDQSALKNLPTFFQIVCKGPDIRIHWLDEKCYSIIVNYKKGSIDFRYAKERGPYEKFTPNKELSEFSKQLVERENLRLAGIDFIKVGETFMCLECNPNPGWAGFHRFSEDEPFLAKNVILKLMGL